MPILWFGEDIEKMPREQLIKIICTLADELNETREAAIRSTRAMADVAKARLSR